MTETLEVIPRQWKVIQTVRERFACRACEAVTQPPAPFHATPRGMFGPNFLAMIGTAKLNDVDPQAWLADVLARIADTPQHQLAELLPWNWQIPAALLKAA